MGSWSSKHTKSDANGLKPHALKEGGWGFYEAAECFGKAKSFDKHDAMSFRDGG